MEAFHAIAVEKYLKKMGQVVQFSSNKIDQKCICLGPFCTQNNRSETGHTEFKDMEINCLVYIDHEFDVKEVVNGYRYCIVWVIWTSMVCYFK